jgi:hypothetical protein
MWIMRVRVAGASDITARGTIGPLHVPNASATIACADSRVTSPTMINVVLVGA